VADTNAVLAELEAEYADQPGVQLDHLDGLTVSGQDWWFNVRASNTEPVVRLNVEAADGPVMADVRDHVLSRLRRER
jgi:phosphomannomutase